MKICHINQKFFPTSGGGETFTYQLAEEFCKLGDEVLVITSSHQGRDKSIFPFKVEEISSFEIERFLFKDTIPQLYDKLKAFNPDVIHIHNYFPFFCFNSISNEFKHKKIILSIHNTPVFPQRVFGDFDNFGAELSFAKSLLNENQNIIITAGSKHYYESLCQIVKNKEILRQINYAVDLSKFSKGLNSNIRNELRINDDNILILCPSRFIERKGIKEAVLALKLLPINYKLLILGKLEHPETKFQKEIIDLIKLMNLSERVILITNEYDYNQINNVYNASDVVILPSYYEGFGIVLLEAMASEIPIVASNVSGINEIITDHRNGILIPHKNHNALAESIKIVMNNQNLRKKLISNGISLVREKYDLKNLVKQFVKIYNE